MTNYTEMLFGRALNAPEGFLTDKHLTEIYNNINNNKYFNSFFARTFYDKGNMEYFLNGYLSDLLYTSVGGFEVPKELEDKLPDNGNDWADIHMKNAHKDFIHPDKPTLLMISEDFGEKKGEFTVHRAKSGGDFKQEGDKEERNDTDATLGNITVRNCHLTSGDAGSSLPNIETVIEKIKEIKKEDNKFIFGGDANIYYGIDNDNNQIENNNTIGLLVNTLKKDPDLKDAIKHVLISKVIVKKQRRFEPFRNAQFATKSDLNIQETMIIIIGKGVNVIPGIINPRFEDIWKRRNDGLFNYDKIAWQTVDAFSGLKLLGVKNISQDGGKLFDHDKCKNGIMMRVKDRWMVIKMSLKITKF